MFLFFFYFLSNSTSFLPSPPPPLPHSAVKKFVSVAEQEMWKKSFSCFEKGMEDFHAIGDLTNTALLLCNTGRLMRICAQAHCAVSADHSRGEFSPEEALYYNKVSARLSFRVGRQRPWDSNIAP